MPSVSASLRGLSESAASSVVVSGFFAKKEDNGFVMFVQESNLLGGGLGMTLSMISSALLTIPAATLTIFADAFMDSLIPRNANCCFMLYLIGSSSVSVLFPPPPPPKKGMA